MNSHTDLICVFVEQIMTVHSQTLVQQRLASLFDQRHVCLRTGMWGTPRLRTPPPLLQHTSGLLPHICARNQSELQVIAF